MKVPNDQVRAKQILRKVTFKLKLQSFSALFLSFRTCYRWYEICFYIINNQEKIDLKGTHTVHFSSSLYIINQKPMIHRTHFHCITTWVSRSSGWNSAMHLFILCFRFTSQVALLSNTSINSYFDCRLCLIVPGRQEKIYFSTRKFLSTKYTWWYKLTGHIFSWHKYMMKSGAPPEKFGVLYCMSSYRIPWFHKQNYF